MKVITRSIARSRAIGYVYSFKRYYITGRLEGLENDHNQSPHWGYVISGELTVTYTHGSKEVDECGDMHYWPPGHTVRAEKDTGVVMVSPQHEHGEVIDHMRTKMEESA